MDFAAVIASVLGVVAPYLSIGADAFARQVGRETGEKVGELFETWAKRHTGNAQAEQTLDDFRAEPRRHARAVAELLLSELESDQGFADELNRLLKGIEPEINVIQNIGNAQHIVGADVGSLRNGRVNVGQTIESAGVVKGYVGNEVGEPRR